MQKSKAVLITTRKNWKQYVLDGHIIESAPYLRYLEVVIDDRMTFQEHLNRTSERGIKAIFALSRYTKRKLLASVSSSNMGLNMG